MLRHKQLFFGRMAVVPLTPLCTTARKGGFLEDCELALGFLWLNGFWCCQTSSVLAKKERNRLKMPVKKNSVSQINSRASDTTLYGLCKIQPKHELNARSRDRGSDTGIVLQVESLTHD